MTLLEPMHRLGTEMLLRQAKVHELSGPADERLESALAESDAVIVRSTLIDESLFALGPKLTVIGRHGAGIDNIDVECAARRGIRVVNTPRSNTNSVAEYVVTAMMMLLKRMGDVEDALRGGLFGTHAGSLPGQVQRHGLVGREISGARLGLVGAGAIGQAVAEKAGALGMTVTAFDPYLPAEVFASRGIARAESLQELASNADVLSVHVPGGGSPVVTSDVLNALPPGAVVINAARGGVVDEIALAEALRLGRLGGAAVDVFAAEPPALDGPLFGAPRTILTPHMAAMTEESLRRMSVDVVSLTLQALSERKTKRG